MYSKNKKSLGDSCLFDKHGMFYKLSLNKQHNLVKMSKLKTTKSGKIQ